MANFASKTLHWIPLFQTVATYDRRWIANDLMAGLSAAGVQIPTAVAYAQLADLPPDNWAVYLYPSPSRLPEFVAWRLLSSIEPIW